jgi:signal transduction histidine kinase
VELREVCRAVIAEFEVRVDPDRLDLQHDDADGQCWATADPGSVARVIRILIDNALGFSPPDEPVTVVTGRRDGGAATVTVADAGPGIPAEERELIFERFRRGSNPAAHGFGLGLAIGRELATRMGGALALVGDGPGARFELRLPAADQGAVEAIPDEFVVGR